MQLSVQPAAGPRSSSGSGLAPNAGARRARRAPRLAVRVAQQQQEVFCRDVVAEPKKEAADIEGSSQLVFMGVGGNAREVEAPKGKYILDSGMDAGLELPFTCRGGICGACVVRVTEGEVDQSDVRRAARAGQRVGQGRAAMRRVSCPTGGLDCVCVCDRGGGFSCS